jgi:hypothetical protein
LTINISVQNLGDNSDWGEVLEASICDSLIILLEPSGLYKPGARLHTRLNAARWE